MDSDGWREEKASWKKQKWNGPWRTEEEQRAKLVSDKAQSTMEDKLLAPGKGL